ncbi:MAG: U32 family peptidase [Planctomycetaceae bacterium]|nr:U32 family peptidase [Planctomycetaceae bacterium]
MQPTILKPELLSPAGSEESMHAAVENGADAVYFGIAGVGNFNARVRAKNIPLEKLGDVVAFLHRRNVKAYLVLNTLAFADELPTIETLLREFATARVDAVLVQDLGIARLANRFCPSLTLHASTQMSLTSAEAIQTATRFGIKRVVLPRELSIGQIRLLKRHTGVELEAFVHGALCISYSGQCLTSLALGGRSANRGCCAQPCRMPYTLIDVAQSSAELTQKQIFSPTDLCALPLLREMIDAGICSFKIEGRLKPPEYVAEVTRIYREAIDEICENRDTLNAESMSHDDDLDRLALTFSRGFSTGWLEGAPPQKLVPGNIAAHRGTPLGTVIEVRRDAAVVRLSATVRRGDGVLFENESSPERSQGGRVYEIFCDRASVKEAEPGRKVLLTFGNETINAEDVAAGQEVRKTDDPRLEREIRKTLQSHRPGRRVPLFLKVFAVVGKPPIVEANAPNGAYAFVEGDVPLEEAKKHPLTLETLKEQFGRLGETVFTLESLDAEIDGKAMVPLSVLGKLRKIMIAALEAEPPNDLPPVLFGKSLDELRQEDHARYFHQNESDTQNAVQTEGKNQCETHLLFRDSRYFEDAALLQRCFDAGCRSFYAELRSRKEYELAAECVRSLNTNQKSELDRKAEFVVVAPRILKPGETRFLESLVKLQPDAVLVRNLGALAFFQEHDIPCIADFSLNIVNDLAFGQLFELGTEKQHIKRVTFGLDLDMERLKSLLARIPAEKVELIAMGRSPLFTMEHCLWKANLVPENQDCKQLCKTRPLKIRDRCGAVHTVRSDTHCRNIVENAEPVSELEHISDWISQGVRHFRIEWDDRLGFANPVDTIRSLWKYPTQQKS